MKKELWYLIGGIALGGSVGSGVSYILTKKKYEKIVNDELHKIRESAVNKVMDDISNGEVMIVKKPTLEEKEEEEKTLVKAFVESA